MVCRARGVQPAAHWLSVRSRAPSPPVLTSFVSRAGGGGGLRSSTAPSKPVSTHLYRARITAQPQCCHLDHQVHTGHTSSRFVTHSSHFYGARITAHCHFYPAQVAATLLPVFRLRYGIPMSRLLHSIISIPPRRRHTRVVRLQHSKVCLFYPAQVAATLLPQRMLHMASLCHGIWPSSGPHRSTSTVHLVVTWFRDKEAL